MHSNNFNTSDLAPAREFLIFDRGGSAHFAIDAFSVQEVLPFKRVAKMDLSGEYVEARGTRWALSQRPGECLPVVGSVLHALRLGQGPDARIMLVGSIHGVRSSLASSGGRRELVLDGTPQVICWKDGERAALFDHEWAYFDELKSAKPMGYSPLALLATPSNELFKLCSRALLSAGWSVREVHSGEDLATIVELSAPRLVLIDPSFEDGAGYGVARTVKTGATKSLVALVSHPALPLNSAMVDWCNPDWAGVVVSYETICDLLLMWKAQ